MKTLKLIVLCAAAVGAMTFASVAPATAGKSIVKGLDADNDGTLDADEIAKSAGAVFDRLEKDGDSTLDRREAGGRISKKAFATADGDHDGTLTKDEFVALAQSLFKLADVDAEGTVDDKELHAQAGRDLSKLIK
jgi:Ca2+-binding EF-hand superfamily protein